MITMQKLQKQFKKPFRGSKAQTVWKTEHYFLCINLKPNTHLQAYDAAVLNKTSACYF